MSASSLSDSFVAVKAVGLYRGMNAGFLVAAANSLAQQTATASGGSPPDKVKPPFITFSPAAYFLSCAMAASILTGVPFDGAQVSGLWQYLQRNMHKAVQADQPHARTVDRRTGRKGMNEAQIPTRDTRPHFGFRHSSAPVNPEFIRTASFGYGGDHQGPD